MRKFCVASAILMPIAMEQSPRPVRTVRRADSERRCPRTESEGTADEDRRGVDNCACAYHCGGFLLLVSRKSSRWWPEKQKGRAEALPFLWSNHVL